VDGQSDRAKRSAGMMECDGVTTDVASTYVQCCALALKNRLSINFRGTGVCVEYGEVMEGCGDVTEQSRVKGFIQLQTGVLP
jgi:hypothetical protein